MGVSEAAGQTSTSKGGGRCPPQPLQKLLSQKGLGGAGASRAESQRAPGFAQPLTALFDPHRAGGGRKPGAQSLPLFLSLPLSLSPPFISLPPARWLSPPLPSLTLLLFLAPSCQPQSPSPLRLLKLISCFLILSSSSEPTITLGRLPSLRPSPVLCPSPHQSLSPTPFPISSLLLLPSCFSLLSQPLLHLLILLQPLFLSHHLRRHFSPQTHKPGRDHPSGPSPALGWEIGVQRPRSALSGTLQPSQPASLTCFPQTPTLASSSRCISAQGRGQA